MRCGTHSNVPKTAGKDDAKTVEQKDTLKSNQDIWIYLKELSHGIF